MPTVSLIEGDGIGPEIASATVRAVEAAGGKVTWERVDAGAGAVDKHKDPLPAATIESIKKNQLALKGPLATPSGGGYRSVNVTLRQHFDLYANVRPVRTIPGVPSRYTDVDLVIVRENTEDLYAGVEHYIDPRRTAAESIAIITKFGSERVIVYAFEYARRHGRKKVTLVHKANILKYSQGLFLEVGRQVAQVYAGRVESDDKIVDACAMELVMRPEKFDVIVTTNLFGDILSDLTSGLVGGLGLTPGANIGYTAAIFEAVHGTAPDIAGKGVANPTAVMLAGCQMLDHVGEVERANRIRQAIEGVLRERKTVTRDVGGSAGTDEYTEAVIKRLGA